MSLSKIKILQIISMLVFITGIVLIIESNITHSDLSGQPCYQFNIEEGRKKVLEEIEQNNRQFLQTRNINNTYDYYVYLFMQKEFEKIKIVMEAMIKKIEDANMRCTIGISLLGVSIIMSLLSFII